MDTSKNTKFVEDRNVFTGVQAFGMGKMAIHRGALNLYSPMRRRFLIAVQLHEASHN